MQKIYRKWWFWVGVVVLILAALYFAGYLKWYAEGAKYRIQNQISNQYIASQEAQQAALEAQYKNDPYGGSTPEATLKLFIEALEKKDYTLASNYFIPEKQKQYQEDLTDAANTGGPAAMVAAFKNGTVKIEKYLNEDQYKVRLYSSESKPPFIFEMIKNPFKDKWLISEL
ncbi:MAG: hypothetical protein Q7R90_03585 [bacterium]|nr:hypothetical protein [bacterium]